MRPKIISTSPGSIERTKRTEKFGKTKRCGKCGLTLPIESFNTKAKRCKHCQEGGKKS